MDPEALELEVSLVVENFLKVKPDPFILANLLMNGFSDPFKAQQCAEELLDLAQKAQNKE